MLKQLERKGLTYYFFSTCERHKDKPLVVHTCNWNPKRWCFKNFWCWSSGSYRIPFKITAFALHVWGTSRTQRLLLLWVLTTTVEIISNSNQNYAKMREMSADNTAVVKWQTTHSLVSITDASFKCLQGFSTVFDKPIKWALSTERMSSGS